MSQSQDEINDDQQGVNGGQPRVDYGQQRVNYELAQIDLKLLEAIKALVDVLKTGNTVSLAPEVVSKLQEIDFPNLEAAISRVADIAPPGCASEQNSESFLRVARTLNIDGPPDWSSHLDDYLYGSNEKD